MIGNFGNFINNNTMNRQCLLLVADLTKNYNRLCLQGLLDQMQGQVDWEVWHKGKLDDLDEDISDLPSQRRDGMEIAAAVILDWEGEYLPTQTPTTSVPLLWITAAQKSSPCPQIIEDNKAIAHSAYEHLCSIGIKHMASFGTGHAMSHAIRRHTFATIVKEQGKQLHVRPQRLSQQEWLQQIPKPCGIFSVTDELAVQVMQYCPR